MNIKNFEFVNYNFWQLSSIVNEIQTKSIGCIRFHFIIDFNDCREKTCRNLTNEIAMASKIISACSLSSSCNVYGAARIAPPVPMRRAMIPRPCWRSDQTSDILLARVYEAAHEEDLVSLHLSLVFNLAPFRFVSRTARRPPLSFPAVMMDGWSKLKMLETMLSIFWLLEHPLAVISNRVRNFF